MAIEAGLTGWLVVKSHNPSRASTDSDVSIDVDFLCQALEIKKHSIQD